MKRGGLTSSKNAVVLILAGVLLPCEWLLAQRPDERTPHRAVDHLQQGVRLARSKKWMEAEREFRIAHLQDPNSTDAEMGHAEALVFLKETTSLKKPHARGIKNETVLSWAKAPASSSWNL